MKEEGSDYYYPMDKGVAMFGSRLHDHYADFFSFIMLDNIIKRKNRAI